MVLGGYFLGTLVPNIDKRINYVIAVVVFLSLLPAIIGGLRARSLSRKANSAEAIAAGEPEREQP